MENTTEIMQHALKMQQISVAQIYKKRISMGDFYTHSSKVKTRFVQIIP
jgi:hypothetical protein